MIKDKRTKHYYFNKIEALILGLVLGCGGNLEPGEALKVGAGMEPEWANYEVTAPAGAMLSMLTESPYMYPTQTCSPMSESDKSLANATISLDENGKEQLCVWESVVGTVPEGESFYERVGCDRAWTQAPSWFVPPTRVHTSDPSLLDDESYAEELAWVRSQAHSGGCTCCHGSSNPNGYATGWDIDAPLVWTDSIANYRLAMLSGMFDEHREFGAIPADQNHGFGRQHTMFPTTDSDRMRAFFLNELERRKASNEDIEHGREAIQRFFGRRRIGDKDCVSPFEGIEEGRVVWNADHTVRQLYVLEQEADIPGFPPSMDRPDGIVWAIYVDPDGDALESGQLVLGELPSRARQIEPADGSMPQFVEGRSYRLYATPDFMRRFAMNCLFKY